MGVFFAAFALATALESGFAVEPLVSRTLPLDQIVVPDAPALNFDLYDARAELNDPAGASEVDPHSIFNIKRHLGFAAGYDNGVAHGSVGMYVTVAEWGRWNFGVTSPGIGFGRYPVFNRYTRQTTIQTQATILISLASVHYRGGYLRSIGKEWYVTFEQVFDARANITGSQFGISFANR